MGTRQFPYLLLVTVLILPLALPWGALGSTGDANGPVVEDTGAAPLQVDYTVGFMTVPAGLELEIDGIAYATPVEFVWEEGELHVIAASSPQYDGDGTRYVWSTWSDYGARVHTIVVAGHENYTAFYETQFRITIDTEPTGLGVMIGGMPTPSQFWLSSGEVMAVMAPAEIYVGNLTRYVFLHWVADPWIPVPFNETTIMLTLTSPQNLTAVYELQYCLFYDVPWGGMLPTNCEWYDDGTTAYASLDSPFHYLSPVTRSVFDHWGGDVSGANYSQSDPILMDGPKIAFTFWTNQYRVDLNTSPLGLNLSVDGVTYVAPVSFWWDADSPHYVYAPDYPPYHWWQYWSDGGEQGHDIEATGPMTITAFYGNQYEISFLGPANLTVEIDNVSYTMPFSFWCDEGASHFIHFPSPQGVGPKTRVEFLSWTDPGFGGNPTVVVCDGPRSTSVVVETQHMVTLNTNPTGLNLEIDGVPYTTPHMRWWDENSSHHIYAPDCPPGCWWQNWSDGGEQGHDIEVSGPMTIIAYYIFGMEVTITAKPLVPVLEVDGMQYAPPAVFRWEYNTLHTINAPSPQVTPNGTLDFSHWSDGGAQSHTIVVDGTDTYVAYYTGIVQVTIDTAPSLLQVYVDGVLHTTPKSFLFPIGSWHTIEAPEQQGGGPNVSWRFAHWSDGGDRSHNIEILGPSSYIAYYDRLYNVTLDTAPSGLNISANGTIFSTPASLWWREGYAVELEAISPQERNGTRYLFIMWADGYYLLKRTIVVSGAVTYMALYKPQHYLSVIIPPPLVSFGPISAGAGWYDDGSLATAGLPVPEFEYDSGRRWVFLFWEGDASGSDFRASEPMVMDRPRTALVAWKAQFLLIVESEHGSPTGGGWYDEGSLAAISIEKEVSVGGHVYRFQGWSGHVSTSSSWLTLRMDSPATLMAHWSEVSEEHAGSIWPILYVATTAALASVLIVAFYLLGIRPGRRGGS